VSAEGGRAGRWRLAGARELFEPLRAELEASARARRRERGPRALGPHAAFYKGSALALEPAVRHALRTLVFGVEVPRLQEFSNLTWLRAHGFLAPRPLLAGVLERRALPRFQFLYSELVPDAPDLAAFLPRATTTERSPIVDTLASDVAALHALGFVHRDLFPRNLLLCKGPAGARCAFLDAWRARPGKSWRGPEHDLACLFDEDLFTAEETRRFLDVYRDERARLGRALPENWAARLDHARAVVRRRESARRRPVTV